MVKLFHLVKLKVKKIVRVTGEVGASSRCHLAPSASFLCSESNCKLDKDNCLRLPAPWLCFLPGEDGVLRIPGCITLKFKDILCLLELAFIFPLIITDFYQQGVQDLPLSPLI